jgi:hypothetical protein
MFHAQGNAQEIGISQTVDESLQKMTKNEHFLA